MVMMMMMMIMMVMMMMMMMVCQIIKEIDSLSLRSTDQILINPKAIKYKDQTVSYR